MTTARPSMLTCSRKTKSLYLSKVSHVEMKYTGSSIRTPLSWGGLAATFGVCGGVGNITGVGRVGTKVTKGSGIQAK